MSELNVDLDLVQKYNVPGPRYTSYPPAPQFTDQVTWPEVAAKISQAQSSKRGLSLYFHIPFCESLCWYCGCTTVITTQRENGANYLDYLEKEMEQMAGRINPEREVTQLHWGGGTPTFFSPDEIRRLGKAFARILNSPSEIEAGVEIDPRRLTPDHVKALAEVGFNRASIGVQDFNPAVQTAMHRIQPREMTEQAIQWTRAAGFQSVNLDLIYGLPHQTVETFENTLEQILELGPDRLAVFSYAHVPWMKPAQKILEGALPSAETKLGILKLVIERLTQDDKYIYIGMDHFARPNDELAVAQRQKTLAAEFPGIQHAGRDGHSRFWHVGHFAGGRRLLAEHQGSAGILQGAGFGVGTVCQGLCVEHRRQNPPSYDHAADV